jgi:hypothetical protein
LSLTSSRSPSAWWVAPSPASASRSSNPATTAAGDAYADVAGLAHTFTTPGVFRATTMAATEAYKRVVVSGFVGTNALILVTAGVPSRPSPTNRTHGVKRRAEGSLSHGQDSISSRSKFSLGGTALEDFITSITQGITQPEIDTTCLGDTGPRSLIDNYKYTYALDGHATSWPARQMPALRAGGRRGRRRHGVRSHRGCSRGGRSELRRPGGPDLLQHHQPRRLPGRLQRPALRPETLLRAVA